jgi:hypothetical protein
MRTWRDARAGNCSGRGLSRALEQFVKARLPIFSQPVKFVRARLQIFKQLLKIVIPSEAEGPAFTV